MYPLPGTTGLLNSARTKSPYAVNSAANRQVWVQAVVAYGARFGRAGIVDHPRRNDAETAEVVPMRFLRLTDEEPTQLDFGSQPADGLR